MRSKASSLLCLDILYEQSACQQKILTQRTHVLNISPKKLNIAFSPGCKNVFSCFRAQIFIHLRAYPIGQRPVAEHEIMPREDCSIDRRIGEARVLVSFVLRLTPIPV
ncbi:hypothetical protein PUN28_003026 [Cardiocondyla obscurior]|uniref:Uncharacterized protein n=1 Tax=Cardiocondyla obscurior TaxID=286306 RepID=A0AAW2GXJ6_9HYME